jgi:hypothetical protein
MLSRIGSAALIAIAAACADRPTIDLCRRGDRVELGNGFSLEFRDAQGNVLATRDASAEATSHFDDAVPSGAVEVVVIGRDNSGTTVAHGVARIVGAEACVCVAREEQYIAACAGIGCSIEGGACRFHDDATGAPTGPRTLRLGNNTADVGAVTRDTFLRSAVGFEDFNYGGDDVIEVGDFETLLLGFDLTALPTTSQVTEAVLTLQVSTESSSATSQLVGFRPVLEEWDEGFGMGELGCASWNCRRAGGVAWTNPGCVGPTSCAEASVAGVFPAMLGATYDIGPEAALTAVVDGWVRQPQTNFGLAARSAGNARFISSEGLDGARPRLSVTFTIPPPEL